MGLSLDASAIDWGSPFIWWFVSALLIRAVASKMIGGFLVGRSAPVDIAIGLARVPRGEVGLILAELGLDAELFSNRIYAALVIVISLTTVCCRHLP